MYLTYEEYRGYGGTLSEAEYPVYEFIARNRVDWLTSGRVEHMAQVPGAVKLAMMVIIRAKEGMGFEGPAESPRLAGFTTDGYSERYFDPVQQEMLMERQLLEEARRMLYGVKDDDGVPLLYRGVI